MAALAGAAFFASALSARGQDGGEHRIMVDTTRMQKIDTVANPQYNGVRYFFEHIPAFHGVPMVGPLLFDNGGIGHVNLDYFQNPDGAKRYFLIHGFDMNKNGMLDRDEISTICMSVVDTTTHDNIEMLYAQRFADGSGVVTKKITLINPLTGDVRKQAQPKDRITTPAGGLGDWIDMINDVTPPHIIKKKAPRTYKPGLSSL